MAYNGGAQALSLQQVTSTPAHPASRLAYTPSGIDRSDRKPVRMERIEGCQSSPFAHIAKERITKRPV